MLNTRIEKRSFRHVIIFYETKQTHRKEFYSSDRYRYYRQWSLAESDNRVLTANWTTVLHCLVDNSFGTISAPVKNWYIEKSYLLFWRKLDFRYAYVPIKKNGKPFYWFEFFRASRNKIFYKYTSIIVVYIIRSFFSRVWHNKTFYK